MDRIRDIGCKAWTLVPPKLSRFKGRVTEIRTGKSGGSSSSYARAGGEKSGPKVIEIATEKGCGDTCVFSNYPIMAGLYDIQGKEGVYYEVTILQMDGVIAIGKSNLLDVFKMVVIILSHKNQVVIMGPHMRRFLMMNIKLK